MSGWSEIEFADLAGNPMFYAENLYINGELLQGDIVIPDGTAKIGDSSFYMCGGLTSITIPDSVTSIGEIAFFNCIDLTTINFQGTKAQWRAIEKASSWDSTTGAFTVICTDGTISKADA